MSSLTVIEDVSKLVHRTDFDALEPLVNELDAKYKGFSDAFKTQGIVLTKDREEAVNYVRNLCAIEKLNLSAILAPFGFGKTVTIQILIDMINRQEIKYGNRAILPVHLRLNRQTDRPKIVKELLRVLSGDNNDESFLRLIFDSIKNDELIKRACQGQNEEWVIGYLKEHFLKNETLDILLDKSSNDVLINLMEKAIQSYESVTGSKVVLIIDEVENSVKGFSDPFVYFLAMIIRNCYEPGQREFAGIIAMTTTYVDQPQVPLFRALNEIGAKDVFQRLSQKHIARELSLTQESAMELLSRILHVYLTAIVRAGKDQDWGNLLEENKNFGDKLFTYPISADLLNYLSKKGLKTSKSGGSIPDFRAYLTLVGATLDAWVAYIKDSNKNFQEMVSKRQMIGISQFWEINDSVRLAVKDYITRDEIQSAIFRQDIIRWIDEQLNQGVEKELFQNTLKRIVLEAVRTGKERFTEDEITSNFGLDYEAIVDFKGCLPSEFKHIINFDYEVLHIDLDQLVSVIVSNGDPLPADQDLKKIKEYLDVKIDDKPLTALTIFELFKKWKVETGEWAVDDTDKQILVEKTSSVWNSTIYFSDNPDKEGEIRDRIAKSGRLDVGLILTPDLDCSFIYPSGLQAFEKITQKLVMDIASDKTDTAEFKELAEKVERVKSGMTDAQKTFLIGVVLPIYFNLENKTDQPSAFNTVNIWAQIEHQIRNPSPACQNRWIETKIGISPETKFKEVASTFMKLVTVSGSETNFKQYDEFIILRHPKVKALENCMNNLDFEKEWKEVPLSPTAFQENAKKKYAEVLPVDETTGGLKIKTLLNRTLQNSLAWLKEESERTEAISLSRISEFFFSVPVEYKNGSVISWNITNNGKRALLLLFSISNYYGDTYTENRNNTLFVVDPAQIAGLQTEKLEKEFIDFGSAVIAKKLIFDVDEDISEPKRFWQQLTNITQDKNASVKEKNILLQNLKNEWMNLGIQKPEVQLGELDPTLRVQKLIKSVVIERNYRSVGQYLKEILGCASIAESEKAMLLYSLSNVVSKIELEINAVEANVRLSRIINNLGALTNEKPNTLNLAALDAITSNNFRLIRVSGDIWAEKFKKEFIEIVRINSTDVLSSGLINIILTKNKLERVIPNVTTTVTADSAKAIAATADGLVSNFIVTRDELFQDLMNMKQKYIGLGPKQRLFSEELRIKISRMNTNVLTRIDELDELSPETSYVQNILSECKNTLALADNLYAEAMSSLGNEADQKLLETCAKYNNNLVELLRSEFNTDIQSIMLNTGGENEGKANAFLLKLLPIASKNKIQLVFKW